MILHVNKFLDEKGNYEVFVVLFLRLEMLDNSGGVSSPVFCNRNWFEMV